MRKRAFKRSAGIFPSLVMGTVFTTKKTIEKRRCFPTFFPVSPRLGEPDSQHRENSCAILTKISHAFSAPTKRQPLASAKNAPTTFDNSHKVPTGSTIVEIVK